ncbi:MAG: shikimate dehydrogenase [Rhodospirillales bacterium]|nr:shikimate dehydrogenase [Rhodospirillales bacterium]
MTISGKAKLAGVIGWPVGHSRSPLLHNHWLARHGIDGAYVPLPVAPADLELAIRALPRLGFAGANLTIPHKEKALALVDRATPRAWRIGAVNTLVVEPDGAVVGDSTDGQGFLANLAQERPGWSAKAGPAVVLGAGGAAAAVAFALMDEGAPEIRIVNRSSDKAQSLAERLGDTARVIDWAERDQALAGAALLVNATSLGMSGQPALALDLAKLDPRALVTDIVYAPLVTDLLQAAQARGNPIVDGLGMLIHQARPGFAAWFGITPEADAETRRVVLGS